MREWSLRDGELQQTLRDEDAACVAAIAGMFTRHGFATGDAFVRARIVYFTQIGYHAVEPGDTEAGGAALTNDYLRAVNGRTALAARIAACHARVLGDPLADVSLTGGAGPDTQTLQSERRAKG